ncbi:helix-turn-helix domain-containing protein [Ruminococcaceae bacterium OttesenSCG-928-A16]|nr:helix-turn-helix domain-containing protein [Ruminococcaceae bacterium OttesenSCG-928-A16]
MERSTQEKTATAKRTYRVEDIAAILDIGKSSAYELVKQGYFTTVKIGSAIRISKKSFDTWLDSQGS